MSPPLQLVFLLCAYVTVYMIYGKFRKTFDSENDTFRLEFLLVPVIGLSFLENYSFTPLEVSKGPRGLILKGKRAPDVLPSGLVPGLFYYSYCSAGGLEMSKLSIPPRLKTAHFPWCSGTEPHSTT